MKARTSSCLTCNHGFFTPLTTFCLINVILKSERRRLTICNPDGKTGRQNSVSGLIDGNGPNEGDDARLFGHVGRSQQVKVAVGRRRFVRRFRRARFFAARLLRAVDEIESLWLRIRVFF